VAILHRSVLCHDTNGRNSLLALFHVFLTKVRRLAKVGTTWRHWLRD
jgi:hypothetical protein